ncbi:TldD/PmbA family protein [candidate division WOR-3 bacterium]|nr:TldD/PmbA family protein [candidate division WOR-3 bacterium]
MEANVFDAEKIGKRFTEYTELRFHENYNEKISFINGSCVANDEKTIKGHSARVFKNGFWGFASNPKDKPGIAEELIKKAQQNAEILSSKLKNGDKIFRKQQDVVFEKDLSTKKAKMTRKEKFDFVKDLDTHVKQNYKKVSSVQTIYSHLKTRKELLTSEGAHIIQTLPRSFIRISLTSGEKNQPVSISESFGGLGDIEDIFSSPEDLYSDIGILYTKLMEKCSGLQAEAGLKDVILGADLAGILAHEAMGHTTEADFVMGGSIAADLLNIRIASDKISLTDFAHTALGETCPMPVFYDDEGVEGKDSKIIENGVLTGYMHNRRSAAYFKVEPTGNARAFSFDDEPLIRMRNTCILPGKDKLEDMISSVEDGYFLENPGNGQADSTSEFMFAVTFGYEIKKGKLGKALQNTAISGKAVDLLKTVTMVSDQMKWVSSGTCGKKQPMPVAMGGPAIKCKVSIGGN